MGTTPMTKQLKKKNRSSRVSNKSARKRRRRKESQGHCSFERLEDRRLLTTTLYIDFGQGFDGGQLSMSVEQLRDINGTTGFPANSIRHTGPNFTNGSASNPTGGLALNDTLTFSPTGSFDRDGEGDNDSTDLNILANEVLEVAQRAFLPFDVDVQIVAARDRV